ncbi:homocysteine S-methyltransferase family protein [Hansschlegelia zhihuaiae]|uniref:Homocysteine methyltransferase n=1 Tax=Hansschlegelia zhihuaiae TaxID=405005 RepID=A0A4Q0MMJ2_9HYPH|nr:homocysteine S-methyltransferase family protein [Hansschlegelia zhihuaiae]RXF75001.1 homocysteine methyltransferase [Hansschlegelia zhihuaiae]
MSKYRHALPQLGDTLFLTDGGMETTFIFHQKIDLPHFASFVLMDAEDGGERLKDYYAQYAVMAKRWGLGFILDSPTWRANHDWGARLGYDAAALDAINRQAIAMLSELRERFDAPSAPVVTSGTIGPRGDGYQAAEMMSAAEAEQYHAAQIASFVAAGADMVAAYTLTYPEEAIGIARAADRAGVPVAISFTLETDGRLPAGHSLRQAIELVDAATGGAPAYYMINCAHPTHFAGSLDDEGEWLLRLRGLRANASKRSHAELDSSSDLDAGDPVELGRQYQALRSRHRQITILGGCCGTDCRHVEEIRFACTSELRAA